MPSTAGGDAARQHGSPALGPGSRALLRQGRCSTRRRRAYGFWLKCACSMIALSLTGFSSDSFTAPRGITREVIANALDEQALTGTEELRISQDAEGRWHIRAARADHRGGRPRRHRHRVHPER
jgi:hypothetical protein